MGDITQIMLNLSNQDSSIRGPAEQMVDQAKQSDIAGFIQAVLNELADESKPEVARRMAGLVLKNSVALDAREGDTRNLLGSRWSAIGADIRHQVKAQVITTLGSSNEDVRRTAALIVANLARVELPAKEWPDLIDTLVAASTSGDLQHMATGLITLGYVCEESDNNDAMADVLEQESEKVIRAIFAGTETDSPVVLTAAARALSYSIEFMQQHMKDPQILNRIISSTCDIAERCPFEAAREFAMEALVKIADCLYDHLPEFMGRLYSVTSNAMQKDTDTVAIQAMLFWDSIARGELELLDNGESIRNLTATGAPQIVQLIIPTLQQQEEGQTDEDWNRSIAASRLLQSITQTIHDSVVPLIMDFIYKGVASNNWHEKEAALVAFGCLIDENGPEPERFADTVAQGSKMLLEALGDANPMVQDTAAWVVGRVAEFYSDIFTQQPPFMQQLITIVGPWIASLPDSLSVRASDIIHNLALQYEEEENMPTNSLSPHFTALVQAFLQRIDMPAPPGCKATEKAIESLNALVDAAALDVSNAVNDLAPELLRRLDQLVTAYTAGPSDEILFAQTLMCGSISALAKKLQYQMSQHLDNTMNVLSRVFQQLNDSALDEGVMLLGTLAECCPDKFLPYVSVVFPLLESSYFKTDEEQLCQSAIGAVGSIIATYKAQSMPYIDRLLPRVLQFMEENKDRDMACKYFSTIGDAAFSTSEGAAPGVYPLAGYIDRIAAVINNTFTASTRMDVDESNDTEDYVMDLWALLCEVGSQLLQGMRSFPGALLQYAPFFVSMACYACRLSRNADVMLNSIKLLGDIPNVFNDSPAEAMQAKTFILVPDVDECVSQGERHSNDDIKESSQWARKELRRLQAIR